jgi:hypothetical protein
MASHGTQSRHRSSLQFQREASAVLAPDANGPGDLVGFGVDPRQSREALMVTGHQSS